MDLDEAERLTKRAVAEAAGYGRPICVSVCDGQGFLVAFARMAGAPVRSIALSQAKAYTAARIGVGTTAFHERLQGQGYPASYFCDPGLTGLPGGAVLRGAGGSVAGGVGISGLLPAEDQVIADLLAGPA
ncbi:MAG: GlcG/HbpS family heme-binding protein [Janthinobacterium lividum]